MKPLGLGIGLSFTLGAGVSALALVSAIPSLAMLYDVSDMTSVFTDPFGATNVSADDQQAALMLDKSRMGGKTAAQFIADQPELRQTGEVVLSGTAPAATYNPATGVGSASTGATLGDFSWIRLPNLSMFGHYAITIQNSGTSAMEVSFDSNSAAVPVGRTVSMIVPSRGDFYIRIRCTELNKTANFTLHSTKHVPGHHRVQSMLNKRPRWKTLAGLCWLQYDGLDDCLPTYRAVNLTATNKLTISGAWEKLSDAAQGILVEPQTTASNRFALSFPRTNLLPGAAMTVFGTGGNTERRDAGSAAPLKCVLAGFGDYSGASASAQAGLQVNGVDAATVAGVVVTAASFPNAVINFGARDNGTGAPANVREYASALFLTTLAGTDLNNFKRWAAQCAGLSI